MTGYKRLNVSHERGIMGKEIEEGKQQMVKNNDKLGVNSTVEEILIFMRNTIGDVSATGGDEEPMNKINDTPNKIQFATGLLNYKGAELNAKATDRLNFTTWVLVACTIVLAVITLIQLIIFIINKLIC